MRYSSHFKHGRRRGERVQKPAHSSPRLDLRKLVNKATPVEETQFVPTHTFSDFALNSLVKTNIASKGYKHPTPIQDMAILPILAGRDVVGIAQTGTGKTAAFLLPLITKVATNRFERVLVLAPTRELALQIYEEFAAFSAGLGIGAVICVGGLNIGPQIGALRRNPNFVIATPGRLKDLVQQRCVHLERFKTVVLDEADRMVDMGFIRDIKFLLGFMPADRHSLFFSATISKEVHGLIQQFLRDPVTVSVKSRDTSSNVDQDIIRVADKNKKLDILIELLSKPEFNKVLIFGRTKYGVEKLSIKLAQRGFKVASIHSNKSQSQRQKALHLFKKHMIHILVATDVAARGLDISDVSHVINYDMPNSYDDYVHRIGRTGRADKSGKALTFVE